MAQAHVRQREQTDLQAKRKKTGLYINSGADKTHVASVRTEESIRRRKTSTFCQI